jgi:hypothetical protein
MKIVKNIHPKKVIKIQHKSLSYIYHNLPTVSQYHLNGKLIQLDSQIELYNPQLRAYLEKKWTSKQDIPPAIKSIQTKKDKILQTQKIDKKYTNLPEELLRFQYDNGFINRNYIMNILLEKNEIDLYKAIMDKLIMNGYTVKTDDYLDYSNIKENINKLVEVFFNGDELTDMEKALEVIYIKEKRNKYLDTPKFLLKGTNFVYTENDYKKYITTFGTLDELKEKLSIDMDNKLLFNKMNWGLILETLQMMGYTNRSM